MSPAFRMALFIRRRPSTITLGFRRDAGIRVVFYLFQSVSLNMNNAKSCHYWMIECLFDQFFEFFDLFDRHFNSTAVAKIMLQMKFIFNGFEETLSLSN